MSISKHHSEAIVTTDGSSHKDTGEPPQNQTEPGWLRNFCLFLTDLSCGVLVCGVKNRNRATHGDVVAVELLPRSEWQGRVAALAEGPGVQNESRTMPTGQTQVNVCV